MLHSREPSLERLARDDLPSFAGRDERPVGPMRLCGRRCRRVRSGLGERERDEEEML